MGTIPNSSVYFAKCIAANGMDMDCIKIGLSHEPVDRVVSVSIQLPFSCELIASVPGDVFLEHFVHMWLRSHKVGGEYFHARGEVLQIAEYARQHGKLPFKVYETGEDNWHRVDVPSYMSKHGITFKEVERLSGVTAGLYRKLIERKPCGNRRFLAALAVTAIKRGLSVTWQRDFIPSRVA